MAKRRKLNADLNQAPEMLNQEMSDRVDDEVELRLVGQLVVALAANPRVFEGKENDGAKIVKMAQQLAREVCESVG